MPDNFQPYFGKQALLTHESSHDTFDETKHKNWLVNNAGIGTYAHGRVHQEFGHTIYVSDMIHKRGHLMSDDILLMEEQDLLSMGEPLSVPTRLGSLKAMAMLPTMNTANGEGALIAYYEHGVVSFDTFEVPRETRYDGEGAIIQKGWDTKRLVNHLLNTVGAVGRYAVSTLTRDHFFRSVRGLHFLKVIIGEGTFNSENINKISMDVEPLIENDTALDGAATGFWLFGNRLFATVGLFESATYSSTSLGRGFVSWNQAVTFTEDRTPRALWEGMWTVDDGIKGIHRFVEADERPSKTSFGFLCSDVSAGIHLARIDPALDHDVRDGACLPIEWSFETARFAPAGLSSKCSINDAVIEMVVSDACQKVRIFSRTDSAGEWLLWHTFSPADKVKTPEQKILLTESFGRPPAAHRECTWVQLRVEGIGAAEIRLLDLEASPSTVKAGRSFATVVSTSEKDFFDINNSPISDRWQPDSHQ